MECARVSQINIHLPDDLLLFVQKTADRETRTVAGQVRHFVAEAARKAGGGNGAALEPWPPPLPTVTRKNLPEIKLQLAEWSEERDALAKRETKVGFGSLMPDEQTRLGQLRNWIATLQVRVDQLEGRPPSEPRRPAPPDLR